MLYLSSLYTSLLYTKVDFLQLLAEKLFWTHQTYHWAPKAHLLFCLGLRLQDRVKFRVRHVRLKIKQNTWVIRNVKYLNVLKWYRKWRLVSCLPCVWNTDGLCPTPDIARSVAEVPAEGLYLLAVDPAPPEVPLPVDPATPSIFNTCPSSTVMVCTDEPLAGWICTKIWNH